jgi:heme exporter protein C
MSTVQKTCGLLLFFLILVQWGLGLFWTPVDEAQGEVYRIIYLHVPVAFAAFACAFSLLISSVLGFKKNGDSFLPWSKAATEIGLIFTFLTLATGAIWGKPTWGTWWTWDARLTTTLLLMILFAGWLLLYNALEESSSRTKACSLLGIMIAADVPIIYKSVTWWRTLHQPQTILRPGGSSTIEPEMLWVLLSGVVLIILLACWFVYARAQNITKENELKSLSLGG